MLGDSNQKVFCNCLVQDHGGGILTTISVDGAMDSKLYWEYLQDEETVEHFVDTAQSKITTGQKRDSRGCHVHALLYLKHPRRY